MSLCGARNCERYGAYLEENRGIFQRWNLINFDLIKKIKIPGKNHLFGHFKSMNDFKLNWKKKLNFHIIKQVFLQFLQIIDNMSQSKQKNR